MIDLLNVEHIRCWLFFDHWTLSVNKWFSFPFAEKDHTFIWHFSFICERSSDTVSFSKTHFLYSACFYLNFKFKGCICSSEPVKAKTKNHNLFVTKPTNLEPSWNSIPDRRAVMGRLQNTFHYINRIHFLFVTWQFCCRCSCWRCMAPSLPQSVESTSFVLKITELCCCHLKFSVTDSLPSLPNTYRVL